MVDWDLTRGGILYLFEREWTGPEVWVKGMDLGEIIS